MAAQDVTVELHYDGDWQDVTSDVYVRSGITITRGRSAESRSTPPAQASLTFDNRDGTYNPTNPESDLYGLVGRNTPIRITVGTDVRFVGEVASWSPRRAVKGDAWTDVVAAGVSRRLGQGADPLGSPLRRYLTAASTVAGYWPLEDLPTEGTTLIPAAVGPDARIRSTGSSIIAPMKFSAEPLLAGSGGLPTLDTERGLAGVEANITVDADPALAAMFWTRTAVPAKSGSNSIFTQATLTLFLQDAAGSIPRYTLTLLTFPPGSTIDTEDTVTVRAGTADDTGASIDTVEAAGEAFLDGWRHVYARFSQDGSDVDVSIRLDDVEVATGTLSSVTLDQVRRMRMGVFTDGGASDQVCPISVGHPVIAAGSTAALDTLAAAMYDAGLGWLGELAEDRFTRLVSTEHGITATYVGTADDTQPMGPQRPATLLELLAEVERTDAGYLFDTRGELGLTFHGGRALYNQDAALELTMDVDVAPPLDPTVDDKDIVNDATASAPGGGEARATLESGAMSVLGPPAGVGRVASRVDVNPMSDSDLLNHAQWAVHVGTVEGARYPQVTVDLTAAGATLIEDASAVDVGDLLTIDDLEPELVRLVVVGYTETIGSHSRRITYNCVPAQPFQIAEVEHATLGVLGSDAATIAEALDTTETGVDINAGAGPDWTYEADFDVAIGGERMTVTAVGAMSGTFPNRTCTLTVTRSVNGVVKSHASGAAVAFADPAYIGL